MLRLRVSIERDDGYGRAAAMLDANLADVFRRYALLETGEYAQRQRVRDVIAVAVSFVVVAVYVERLGCELHGAGGGVVDAVYRAAVVARLSSTRAPPGAGQERASLAAVALVAADAVTVGATLTGALAAAAAARAGVRLPVTFKVVLLLRRVAVDCSPTQQHLQPLGRATVAVESTLLLFHRAAAAATRRRRRRRRQVLRLRLHATLAVAAANVNRTRVHSGGGCSTFVWLATAHHYSLLPSR